MRDHRKLRAFQLADKLVLAVYRETMDFPKEEMYGLTSQMRRAAMSIASNIVEGSARHTEKDYLRFLDMSFSSSKELGYQLTVAHRLDMIGDNRIDELLLLSEETSKVLSGLIASLRKL